MFITIGISTAYIGIYVAKCDTPDQVLKKVEAFDNAGLDHLSLFTHFGPGQEDSLRSLRLFADEVMKPYRLKHASEMESKLVLARQGVACGIGK